MISDTQLAQMLLKRQLITPAQLSHAQEMAKMTGGTLMQIVVKLNYVKQDVIHALVAELKRVQSVGEGSIQVDFEAMEKIGPKLIKKHHIVAIKKEDARKGTLTLAMTNPDDYGAIEEIQFVTGLNVEGVLASKEAITKALRQYEAQREERRKSGGGMERGGEEALAAQLERLLQQSSQKVVVKAMLELLVRKNVFTLQELVELTKRMAT
ncbi:MAG: hypothetical protein D6805_09200 [Planctomycetota bacterium]|nr:MAG: hypothetical protein D6805_09200 [Planctomycetota bacterium]